MKIFNVNKKFYTKNHKSPKIDIKNLNKIYEKSLKKWQKHF